jgi:hypothetical protein
MLSVNLNIKNAAIAIAYGRKTFPVSNRREMK